MGNENKQVARKLCDHGNMANEWVEEMQDGTFTNGVDATVYYIDLEPEGTACRIRRAGNPIIVPHWLVNS